MPWYGYQARETIKLGNIQTSFAFLCEVAMARTVVFTDKAPRAIGPHHHQAGGFQHFQVLGDSRPAYIHAIGYLAHRPVSLAQPPEDRPAGGISKRIQRALNS